MKCKIFIPTFLFLLVGTASAQTDVTPFVPGVTMEGVTYYLPKTAFRITITATRTTHYPGDFKDYSGKYLRLNDVTQETTTQWKIDNVRIDPYGVPDKTKVFSIPLNKKTVAPLVGLTNTGIITSINTEGTEETLPILENTDQVVKSNLNPRDYMTEEILVAGSKAKMAELTANEIYDIRESRSELSKGQSDNLPKDGEQLKVMMNQLSIQEEALLQMFKGTIETETKTFTLYYTPEKEVAKQVLFRFSQDLGVVENDNLAGTPVYIDIVDKKTVPPVQENPKAKKTEEQSVRYTVPSQASVKIYDRSQTYTTLETPMGQFGRTEILSSELFNKRITTQVLFSSTTGGLKKVTDTTGGM